jgi:hypothetical protein
MQLVLPYPTQKALARGVKAKTFPVRHSKDRSLISWAKNRYSQTDHQAGWHAAHISHNQKTGQDRRAEPVSSPIIIPNCPQGFSVHL